VIDLTAAGTLGLTIPSTLQGQADDVIQQSPPLTLTLSPGGGEGIEPPPALA